MVNKILSLLSVGKYFVLQSEMSPDDGDKMVITFYKEHKKAIKCNNVASNAGERCSSWDLVVKVIFA